MTLHRLLAACLGLLLGGCGPRGSPVADGGPNLLDPSFGSNGITQTSFDCAEHASPSAIVAVGGGGLVVGGNACRGWALVGYTASGAIDPSFGRAGTSVLFPDAGDYFGVRALVARPDGRLVARGTGNTRDFVRQFSAAGAVDEAFSAAVDGVLGGLSVTFIQATALQPDGRLLIASTRGEETLIVRVQSDGSLDASFGAGGTVTVRLPGIKPYLTGLLVHRDGRIVLCGANFSGGLVALEPFVAQLTAEGALDPSFGNEGLVKLRLPLTGTVWIRDAIAQSDGKVLLAGSVRSSGLAHDRAALWRLTSAGAADRTFGASGEAEAPAGDGPAAFTAVAVLADGKIVAAGSHPAGPSAQDAWLVARFTSSGELDSTFGTTGFSVFAVSIPWGPGGATALALTPSGYVLTGRAYPAESVRSNFGLARILP